MNFFDLTSLSIPALSIIFLLAAAVVWIGGKKLSVLSDEMATQTGIGRALIGVLMLGGITSLPEVATTLTASLAGNAGMAVSNILGGVSMQVTILAVVDFWVRKQPISTSTSGIVVIMQGLLLIILLAFSGIFMLIPSWMIFHVGISSVIIFFLFLFSLLIVHRFNSFEWVSFHKSKFETIQHIIKHLQEQELQIKRSQIGEIDKSTKKEISVGTYLWRKGGSLLLLSMLILVAGYIIVKTSESIAMQTGIGNNFAGLVLVAITTSLPEISTTIGSVKLKRYDMAFSNIFGTNLFDVALVFIADLFFMKGAVLGALDNFTVVAAFHGIILTAVYLTGISAKSRKRFLGTGFDSWLILILYISGIIILFNMKG